MPGVGEPETAAILHDRRRGQRPDAADGVLIAFQLFYGANFFPRFKLRELPDMMSALKGRESECVNFKL